VRHLALRLRHIAVVQNIATFSVIGATFSVRRFCDI